MKNDDHKELVVVFSGGSDKEGNLSKETEKRFFKTVSVFAKEEESDIIFAEDVPQSLFFPEKKGNYLQNVKKIFSDNGVLSHRIKTISGTLSTVAEINAVINFVKTHSEYKKIYFVSSWYHVLRILFMWLCRGKWAWPIPVWVGGCVIPLRLLAELPKLVLTITPASFQNWLVKRIIKKTGRDI